MKARVLTLGALAALASAWAVHDFARGGQTLEIPWYTVDSGGAELTGGPYRLMGTTGQPEDGVSMEASPYRLRSGFWAPLFNEVVTTAPDDRDARGLPTQLRLSAPVPNPFNPHTILRFELPAAGPVELAVHDLSGRRIAVLVSQALDVGRHEVVWNGLDAQGRPVASGVYVAVLQAAAQQEVQRLTLVK